MSLTLRPQSECKYDLISLGEIMLRLDPGEGRIRTAREFKAWEGGRGIQCGPWTTKMFWSDNRGRYCLC